MQVANMTFYHALTNETGNQFWHFIDTESNAQNSAPDPEKRKETYFNWPWFFQFLKKRSLSIFSFR